VFPIPVVLPSFPILTTNKTMCGVLNTHGSLEVYEAYMTELPPGDIGHGGFVRWRKWEGRLADSCTIQDKCSGHFRSWPKG
jgi:hypothetical protein